MRVTSLSRKLISLFIITVSSLILWMGFSNLPRSWRPGYQDVVKLIHIIAIQYRKYFKLRTIPTDVGAKWTFCFARWWTFCPTRMPLCKIEKVYPGVSASSVLLCEKTWCKRRTRGFDQHHGPDGRNMAAKACLRLRPNGYCTFIIKRVRIFMSARYDSYTLSLPTFTL